MDDSIRGISSSSLRVSIRRRLAYLTKNVSVRPTHLGIQVREMSVRSELTRLLEVSRHRGAGQSEVEW